jgi:hypothetical protein
LDLAASRVREIPGHVLEVGLGKGRTYDRLRILFPEREIFAFDRVVDCASNVRPDPDHLYIGDLPETLATAAGRLGRGAALVHVDVGSKNPERDRRLAERIAPLLDALVTPGGLVLSDREMVMSGWTPLSLPPEASGFAYYIYLVGEAQG